MKWLPRRTHIYVDTLSSSVAILWYLFCYFLVFNCNDFIWSCNWLRAVGSRGKWKRNELTIYLANEWLIVYSITVSSISQITQIFTLPNLFQFAHYQMAQSCISIPNTIIPQNSLLSHMHQWRHSYWLSATCPWHATNSRN